MDQPRIQTDAERYCGTPSDPDTPQTLFQGIYPLLFSILPGCTCQDWHGDRHAIDDSTACYIWISIWVSVALFLWLRYSNQAALKAQRNKRLRTGVHEDDALPNFFDD